MSRNLYFDQKARGTHTPRKPTPKHCACKPFIKMRKGSKPKAIFLNVAASFYKYFIGRNFAG